MKVFLNPTGLYSPAMIRIADSLAKRAPEGFEVVNREEHAELVVLHVIGAETVGPVDKQYAVIQYCGSQLATVGAFNNLWSRARMVWSYYDLREFVPRGVPFLHSPLGVEAPFTNDARWPAERAIDVITSGRVTGPTAEAIEEVAIAASLNNKRTLHIGPAVIEGWQSQAPVPGWQSQEGMNDETLAMLYRNSKRVSGLRQGEGFELPVVEGLLNGCRPVVFDRADMRQWYDGVAEFVPEAHGEELIATLQQLFATEPRPVTQEEVQWAREFFNWDRIADQFWQTLREGTRWSARSQKSKQRLLWIGDAVASTGFAKGTHGILETVRHDFDVHVLGLNYHGDPHDYPYKVYPAMTGGDYMGLGRVRGLVEALGPSVVVVQNDPWHIQEYVKRCGNVPVVGAIAVDGKNCKGTELNGLAHAAFWTQFALEEARLGGFTGPASVIPLGVDMSLFKPMDKAVVRERFGLPKVLTHRGMPENTFILGGVGRNQWRKRWDLLIQYFAEWIKSSHIDDAALWIHSAPTSDDAWDLSALAGYYGIANRVMIPNIPRTLHGSSEKTMAEVYNIFDVLVSTTLGEGFGLPMFEAMASRVPVIAPRWSALGELCDGQPLAKCSATCVHPNQVCVIGGVPDIDEFISAMDMAYRNRNALQRYGDAAYARACEPHYRWENVGQAWLQLLHSVLDAKPIELAIAD